VIIKKNLRHGFGDRATLYNERDPYSAFYPAAENAKMLAHYDACGAQEVSKISEDGRASLQLLVIKAMFARMMS